LPASRAPGNGTGSFLAGTRGTGELVEQASAAREQVLPWRKCRAFGLREAMVATFTAGTANVTWLRLLAAAVGRSGLRVSTVLKWAEELC